ncbi:type IV pilus twitching motility protein PilT [Bacillota bacterium]
MELDLIGLLQYGMEKKVSDIHLTVGRPPTLRVRGELVPVGEKKLMPDDTREICYSMMNGDQIKTYEENGEVDFAWSLPQISRYRVNVYRQRGSCAIALRMISNEIPTFEEMQLPEILKDLALKPRGLVLVTGPTGSGKSTTLAVMTQHININRKCHVLTIEEPIEYMHRHNQSIVNQREVGDDTKSFSNALRAALREDPDVILIGEMRDLPTISTALTAAETGHFVMSTLHTNTAAKTIDRIIDAFPSHQQQQVRGQLSNMLEGIVCQQLIRTEDNKGRVPAFEVLLVNDAVRNLIREDKLTQIETVLQTNIKNGMMPMDYSLAKLVKNNLITIEDAKARAVDIDTLRRYMET